MLGALRSIAGRAKDHTISTAGTVSSDGRRIFFTVETSLNAQEGDIYLREDSASTLQVNASEKATPDAPQPATFWGASKDGSKAFFTTREQLIADDTNTVIDLYRYDRDMPAGSRLTLVSKDNEPGDGMHDVLSVYGVSDDGAYAYFTSGSQLVPGEPLAPAGEVLAFSWHAGTVSYVGITTGLDDVENVPSAWNLFNQTSRVSADGRHVLFISQSTHQPTGDASADCDGTPCQRLYLYSADANGGDGSLVCVSCRPDGAPSTGTAVIVPRVGTGGAISDPHLNHALSDDGRRVFFSTDEALLPEDHNGDRSDVYMYDVPSGQLHLISRGTGDGSYFMDASPNGDDVFFTTREQLVGSDTDDNVDLYDARVGGGFPEPSVPVAPCASADDCKGAVAGSPSAEAVGSLSFHGSGDETSHGARGFRVLRLSAHQLRLLAAGARVGLGVRVSGRGRIVASLHGALGGRMAVLDRASKLATRRGAVRIWLALSTPALDELRARGRLRLVLAVRYGPNSRVHRQTVTLVGSHRSGR